MDIGRSGISIEIIKRLYLAMSRSPEVAIMYIREASVFIAYP